MKSNNTERIDKLLVDLGLVSTRARAQAMILAGHVLVNDVPITKAGMMVARDALIRLKEPELKYVSRGALKLKAALEHFQINVQNKLAIDIGASTGGFTEILLENGAKQVQTIDVGTNQLAWKLRSDPRVKVRENVNARYLEPKEFEERFDIMVMDVSFISVRLILPALLPLMHKDSDWIVLYKPQFEVGREWIEPGGIVKDQSVAKQTMQETIEWARSIQLEAVSVMDSPIQGTDGNHEYLIHFRQFFVSSQTV